MSKSQTTLRLAVAVALALGASISTQLFAQQPNVTVQGRVAIYTAPAAEKVANTSAIGEAQAMPLPTVDMPPVDMLEEILRQPSLDAQGAPSFSPGSRGTGVLSPVKLPPESDAAPDDGGVASQEYGTSNHPFTTARVDTASPAATTPARPNHVSMTYPYRAAGKLYFRDGTSSFVCSASLIKRGLVVTAAHCVASFGNRRFYTNFQYVPARYNTLAPYGIWNGEQAYVMTSYLNGTETCAVRGVVCPNDVAVIRIAPQSAAFPGNATGWFGYGTNGYGFTPGNLALINQLGYPVSHDSGLIMHRTDSQGFVSATNSNNTIWGSRQTGGSSGGPELVNLGIRGVLNATTAPLGSEANSNTVVGVTSWGYTNPAVKQMGASPFTTANIGTLVTAACVSGGVTRPACQ